MVFDPETHAGLDYNYEGRSKLARSLNIDHNGKNSKYIFLILLILNLLSDSVDISNSSSSHNEHPQLEPWTGQLLNLYFFYKIRKKKLGLYLILQ